MAPKTKAEQHAAWQHLENLATRLRDRRIDDLLTSPSHQSDNLRLSHGGLYLDLSKNRIDQTVVDGLNALFQAYDIDSRLRAQVAGEQVNATELRPALHTALRTAFSNQHAPHALEIREQYRKSADLATRIQQGRQHGFSGKAISDVINIGIGGSDLGPRMATTALEHYHTGSARVHFVSSLDGAELADTLAPLSADTTLLLISSKSFSTEETLFNARQAMDWFSQRSGQTRLNGHFAAITGNPAAATALGIPAEDIFVVPEWVGGRYSLWSAIGLPLMIAIGTTHFEQMLAGAHSMDEHAQRSEFTSNLPAMLAALEVWNGNILGYGSLAIIPYSYRLRLLPAYLQQLIMESNGKSRTTAGAAVQHSTAPLIWGTAGTEGQHSYHQWLLQGTQTTPVDFILPLGPRESEYSVRLASHCIAQSKALMEGKTLDTALSELLDQGLTEAAARAIAPHKTMPGNSPSNTLVMDDLNPANLGALLAMYEHKTFFTSVLWDINAFDQWGVELGKQLSRAVLAQLNGTGPSSLDASSNALIAHLHTRLS